MSPLRSVIALLSPPIVWHGYRWLRSPPEFRDQAEIRRCAKAPRYVPMTMRLDGREISVIDGPSAAGMANVYFGSRQAMRFTSDRSDPLIIDCGANVGISVLYWKMLYPHSRVIAFEPDPDAFACLQRNCASFPDVELHDAACWTSNGDVSFVRDNADGGCMATYGDGQDSRRSLATVKAIRLRDMLTEPIELLKMDIEGAEVDVILDCADRLSLVRRLVVEYHSFEHHEQRLDELLGVFRTTGFRISLDTSEHLVPQPLLHRRTYNCKDMHVNIFAVR